MNVIFTLDIAVSELLSEKAPDGTLNPYVLAFKSTGAHWVGRLPECRNDDGRTAYQAEVPDKAVFESIKSVLDSLDSPEVIGVWGDDGLQIGYIAVYDEATGERSIERDIAVEIDHPFDIAKYANILADIVERDEIGEEISRRRPTIEEARSIQVNRFAGNPDRDLTTYVN